LVLWTLERGLSGLENLALIPGTVGAAPIQNIGAYGVEIAQLIHVVEVIDITDRQLYRFDRESCHFSYRNSRFKQEADRYLVTAVEFSLSRYPVLRLGYTGIHEELAAMSIDDPSAYDVAQAVIRLRRHKLPDPAVLGNAGSFFKNPIVPAADALALHDQYPQLPVFEIQNKMTCKLSAAWLIDACGWKGHRHGDAGIAPSHALVLVNHGHATGIELLSLARKVADSVYERFQIRLEPEPRLIGALW
jgi:UDP-N-acetylmuramate dehydrogenase